LIDGFVGHLGVGRKSASGRAPRGIAAGEIARRLVGQSPGFNHSHACKHAVFGRQDERAVARNLLERTIESCPDREPRAGNVRAQIVAAERKIDNDGRVAGEHLT
jgi:hypothetical protein